MYYSTGGVEVLAGITNALMYIITGLTLNVNYTIRIELTFASSMQTNSSISTFHLLSETVISSTSTSHLLSETTPTVENSSILLVSILVPVLIVFIAAVVLIIIIITLSIYWIKKRTPNPVSKEVELQVSNASKKAPDQIQPNISVQYNGAKCTDGR